MKKYVSTSLIVLLALFLLSPTLVCILDGFWYFWTSSTPTNLEWDGFRLTVAFASPFITAPTIGLATTFG